MILVLSTVLRRQNKWITSKADVGGKALMGNLAEMLSKALKTKQKLNLR